MTDERSLAVRPDPTLIAKYAIQLCPRMVPDWNGGSVPSYAPPNHETNLIPLGELPALIAALRADMEPATPRHITAAVAMIASAWPYAHQKVESGLLDAFTAQLREELATFPADVLVGAIKSLRRTCKFSPSIAELYEAADTLLDDKKMRLRVALDHLSEHQARAERKRLAALPWEEREAERWRG